MMNQGKRFTERKCYLCKKNEVMVRQVYNRHISDWEDCELTICDNCKNQRGKRED